MNTVEKSLCLPHSRLERADVPEPVILEEVLNENGEVASETPSYPSPLEFESVGEPSSSWGGSQFEWLDSLRPLVSRQKHRAENLRRIEERMCGHVEHESLYSDIGLQVKDEQYRADHAYFCGDWENGADHEAMLVELYPRLYAGLLERLGRYTEHAKASAIAIEQAFVKRDAEDGERRAALESSLAAGRMARETTGETRARWQLVAKHFEENGSRSSAEIRKAAEAFNQAYDTEAADWNQKANDFLRALVAASIVPSLAAVVIPTVARNEKTGTAEPTFNNVYAACVNSKIVGFTVGYDGFRGETVVSEDGGLNWRPIVDADYVTMHRHLERARFKPRVPMEVLRACVHAIGMQVRNFDTAQLWLGRLQWDGSPRIERFLIDYAGAEDTPYTRAVSCMLWTALAGRVLEPGVQVDMVVVLVGKQGARKTSLVRAIVPHSDHYTEIDLSKRDDDLSRSLRGTLIAELGELRGLATRDLEAIKTFVTRRVEHFVEKYREHASRFARRCVFVGTTNEVEFLSDPSGERRWLPVMVGPCDPDAVAHDREQLWAEAAVLFQRNGVAWRDAERLASLEHHKFKIHDVWEDQIVAWLQQVDGDGVRAGEKPFTTSEVMGSALGIMPSAQKTSDQRRVAKILRGMGYEKDTNAVRVDGERQRFWRLRS